MTYKVLWVDDDTSIVKGYKLIADTFGIELDHYETWETAEKSLRKYFDDYSAIILDAKCKINPDDNASDEFIPTILPALTRLFGEERRVLPWYILSTGTMRNFDFVIRSALANRKDYEGDWGPMIYYKNGYCEDGEDSSQRLFNNIIQVSKNQPYNKVIYNYHDVFKYLGDDQLIDTKARPIMLLMLVRLYYPEEVSYFKYEGNPLRRVMEYLYRAAYEVGLLPQECFGPNNQVNLIESNRYMSGLVTQYSGIRYGNEGDTIFPEYLGKIALSIINFGNSQSHVPNVNEYTIDDGDLGISAIEKELFFSYVLQLCHIIKFFGAFVDNHPNRDKNKRMKRVVNQDVYEKYQNLRLSEYKNKYEGKVFVVEQDTNNNFHCGECRLSFSNAQGLIGQHVRLTNIKKDSTSNSEYLVFAEFEQINN